MKSLEVLSILSLIWCTTVAGDTIDDLPHPDDSDRIEVYYLESPFPYNVPSTIRGHAGSTWLSYGLSHAGLGFKNKDSDKDYTIEQVTLNYVGALLPTISDNTITWENTATIIVTKDVNSSYWITSTYLATISGAVFNDVRDWLEDNYRGYFPAQPVTIQGVTSSDITVSLSDSYAFVDDLLDYIADRAVKLKTFVDVYHTKWIYYSGAEPKVVDNPSGEAYDDIVAFYSSLSTCLQDLYFDQSHSMPDFIENIAVCYQNTSVAYVYNGQDSYVAVTLAAPNASVTRVAVDLPDEKDEEPPGTVWLDYFSGIAVVIAFLVGLASMFSTIKPAKSTKLSAQAESLSTHLLSPWDPNEVQMIRKRLLGSSGPVGATLQYAEPGPGLITIAHSNPFVSSDSDPMHI